MAEKAKSQTVQLGKLKLKTRITIKHLKRLKELTGIDFTSQDTAPMLDFAVDPTCVATACYALYEDQFADAKIDEDGLDELLGPEEIAALREEVTEQMKSFSKFWTILATEMEGLQSGNIDLVERAAKIQEANLTQGVSGPSS